ncbi:MAG: tyrosine-type recombinase/integrase [Bacteroidota bacterium]|nr:tyrosine-type recombinase/integrase [Bacteroidota bacterium]
MKEERLRLDNEKIIQEFLREMRTRGRSPNTIGGYTLDLNQFFKSVNKNYLEVTFRDVKNYFNEMTDSKTSRTVARKMAAVRSFYKYIEEIMAEENKQYVPPTKTIKTPKMPKRVPKYLTHEEVLQVINVAHCLRDKAVMWLLYTSACRIDELFKLNRDDMNWDTKSMNVIGKGNKERISQFNEEAKNILLEYLATRTDGNPALFTEKGDLRLSKRTIQKFVRLAGKEAGIKKPVTPHKFRHSLASRMVQNGAPIQAVQALLGHNDIATTQIYAYLDNKTVRNEYNAVFDK